MNHQSYWKEADIPRYPSLGEPLNVDVLIIGGGITGLSTAHVLAQTGLSVVLVERKSLGSGDTVNTTAHLTYMTDTRLSEIVRVCGKEEARIAWQAGWAAMDHIRTLAARLGKEVGLEDVDGYLSAADGVDLDEEIPTLKDEAALASSWGFDLEYMEETPVLGLPGIRFPGQAKFHPGLYLAAIAAEAVRLGARIFEETDVSEFGDDGRHVTANGHKIRYNHVVIATHVPIQGDRGTLGAALFQTKLALYSTYAVAALYPKGELSEFIWSDTADPFNYLRIDRTENGDVAILGGEDHKTGQIIVTDDCFSRLEKRLGDYLGDVPTTHRWSGQVVETVDGLPFIGPTSENQFIATGFSGNGMTFGVVAALMAKDHILGKINGWEKTFSPDRRHLGALATYFSENKDYPFRMVRDRIGLKDEAEDLLVGEGRVVKRAGKIIATCKDLDGKIRECSAICPHMGCVVAWNHGEQTWDCPCHGSRFQPDGTLMAGPAEEGLAK
jgi:glycine/D-amino acid oxidase-like deaminating enzyme/nitrite reductase/ring-hydroxylating ferredoxin subunit